MASIQALKGTHDILPDEVIAWQYMEAIAQPILHRAAYREIRPPMFERTELFARGIGEATDVVGKEMYTFKDKGDRSVTLRPEGTAGVVRAYIENSLYAKGSTQRLWYQGPMFRYENPQAGRQRQFHQLGIESLGSGDPRADVEVIAIAFDILNALGIKNLRMDLNSVGTPGDRQQYREALIDYLTPYKADLDPDSQDRLTRNPMRILDSKSPKTKEIVQSAPKIWEHLAPDSLKRFEQVQQQLTDLGIDFTLNHCLVRGLDYYTHTAFEIISDSLGAQDTVCGGGRYDGLVAQLGGPDTPAVGWAMGLERLMILLAQSQTLLIPDLDFYIVSRGDRAESQAMLLAQKLRELSFSVELDLSGSAFGKQFKRADRSGAVACLVVGDAEAESGQVNLKWLSTGEQAAIAQSQLPIMAFELKQKIQQARTSVT